MASAQAFGTTSNWIALVGSGDESLWECKIERAQRLCQRCDANTVDDVEHMIYDCVAMDAERHKHQSLCARGRVALVCRRPFHPGQNWLLLCTIVTRIAKSD